MSSFYVIDPSVALAWLLPDEADTLADTLRRVVETGSAQTWIPTHWWLEITNGLLMAERRGRITPAQIIQAISLFNSLPFEEDEGTAKHATTTTLGLARKHHLTIYDAAYLELAQRLGAILVTLDAALLRAADNEGVPLLKAE